MHENTTTYYGVQSVCHKQIQYEVWPDHNPFSFKSKELTRFFNLLSFLCLVTSQIIGISCFKEEVT